MLARPITLATVVAVLFATQGSSLPRAESPGDQPVVALVIVGDTAANKALAFL